MLLAHLFCFVGLGNLFELGRVRRPASVTTDVSDDHCFKKTVSAFIPPLLHRGPLTRDRAHSLSPLLNEIHLDI